MKTDYGVLTNLVKAAGTLITAAVAIGATWRGRANWEPSEVDIAKSPEKIAGLVTAVAIAVIWARLSDTAHISLLTQLAIAFAVVSFASLIVYSFLVGTRTFQSGAKQKLIGGFVLTRNARKALRNSDNRLTTQEYLIQNNSDPDKVWTRNSRAAAKTSFLFCYIALVACGTIALSCASILLLLSASPQQPKAPRDKKVIHFAIVLNGDIFYTRQIMEGFTTKLDALLEPTAYIAHYDYATGVAEAPDNAQNEAVFNSLFARFPQKPDYLVTIGTQVSEYAYQRYKNQIPLIFIGVTDPVASGLVKTFNADPNRGLIAGTLYDPPVNPYIEFFNEAFPGKTFGFVYNPSLYHQDEIYKDRLMQELTRSTTSLTIKPTLATIPRVTEEQQDQVDIFFGRYYVGKHLQEFISSSRKPFITASVYGPAAGAIASISTDTTEIGRIAAERIVYPNLTEGIALSSMPIVVPEKTLITVNLSAARKYNISIGQRALARADKVIN